MNYGLCGAIQSSVLGDGPQPGGIDVDCGYSLASDEKVGGKPTGNSIVTGTKHIKFKTRPCDWGMDAWVKIALKAMVDEIANVGVCCQGGTPPEGECSGFHTCEEALGTQAIPEATSCAAKNP
jgi:hypothetical protein